MNERHVHEWVDATTDDDRVRQYVCSQCATQTAGCCECGTPLLTALAVCDRCLHRAKRLVQDVIDALDTVPFHHAEILGLRAVRYDRPLVHASGDRERLPFGMDAVVDDPEDTRIEAIKFPRAATDILDGWARAWADELGVNHPHDPLPWLVEHTLWAIQNPGLSGWDDYRTEAKQVRAVVRRLLGINPVHESAPCVHCGGPVVRQWLPDGLDDERRCLQCGMTWEDGDRLRFTNHLRVLASPVTDPDTLVTIEQARLALPDLRRNTLNQVLKRDRDRTDPQHRDHDPRWHPRLPVHGRNVRGENLYRLGDVAAIATPDAATA